MYPTTTIYVIHYTIHNKNNIIRRLLSAKQKKNTLTFFGVGHVSKTCFLSLLFFYIILLWYIFLSVSHSILGIFIENFMFFSSLIFPILIHLTQKLLLQLVVNFIVVVIFFTDIRVGYGSRQKLLTFLFFSSYFVLNYSFYCIISLWI